MASEEKHFLSLCICTLLQAKCNAVFLCASCSVKSALALLTNNSATHEKVTGVKGVKTEDQQCL